MNDDLFSGAQAYENSLEDLAVKYYDDDSPTWNKELKNLRELKLKSLTGDDLIDLFCDIIDLPEMRNFLAGQLASQIGKNPELSKLLEKFIEDDLAEKFQEITDDPESYGLSPAAWLTEVDD